MEPVKSNPPLRLVNKSDAPMHRPLPLRDRQPRGNQARGRQALDRTVAQEMVEASHLQPTDARWVLAVRVAESLESGRMAILPPERRTSLVRLATHIGLRPFDANLIIAIVQDGARSGEGALGHPVASRLTLVRGPQRDDTKNVMVMACVSILTGALIFAVLLMLLFAK